MPFFLPPLIPHAPIPISIGAAHSDGNVVSQEVSSRIADAKGWQEVFAPRYASREDHIRAWQSVVEGIGRWWRSQPLAQRTSASDRLLNSPDLQDPVLSDSFGYGIGLVPISGDPDAVLVSALAYSRGSDGSLRTRNLLAILTKKGWRDITYDLPEKGSSLLPYKTRGRRVGDRYFFAGEIYRPNASGSDLISRGFAAAYRKSSPKAGDALRPLDWRLASDEIIAPVSNPIRVAARGVTIDFELVRYAGKSVAMAYNSGGFRIDQKWSFTGDSFRIASSSVVKNRIWAADELVTALRKGDLAAARRHVTSPELVEQARDAGLGKRTSIWSVGEEESGGVPRLQLNARELAPPPPEASDLDRVGVWHSVALAFTTKNGEAKISEIRRYR